MVQLYGPPAAPPQQYGPPSPPAPRFVPPAAAQTLAPPVAQTPPPVATQDASVFQALPGAFEQYAAPPPPRFQQPAQDETPIAQMARGVEEQKKKNVDMLDEHIKAHPEDADLLNPTPWSSWAKDIGTGIAKAGLNVARFGARMIDEVYNPLNQGKFFNDRMLHIPTLEDSVNMFAAHAGLSFDEAQKNAGDNKDLLQSLYQGFVVPVKTGFEIARMPPGKGRDDAYDSWAYSTVQNFASGLTLGAVDPLIKDNMFYMQNGELYYKNVPISALNESAAKGETTGRLTGNLAGGLVTYGLVSPMLTSTLRSIPALNAVYEAHPYLASTILTNGAQQGFDAVVRKTTGQQYSFLDTVTGLMSGLVFETSKLALGGFQMPESSEVQMSPEDKVVATRTLMEEAAKQYTQDAGHPPSLNDFHDMLAKEMVPGTDVTFDQVHNMLANSGIKEARLIELKAGKNGTPGIDLPAEPPTPPEGEPLKIIDNGDSLSRLDIPDGENRFSSVEDMMREIGRSKNGMPGLQLNKNEFAQLNEFMSSIQNPENIQNRGIMYKSYGGDKDVMLGALDNKTLEGYPGRNFVVAEIEDGRLNGRVRIHGTYIDPKNIIGKFGSSQLLLGETGEPAAQPEIVPTEENQRIAPVDLSKKNSPVIQDLVDKMDSKFPGTMKQMNVPIDKIVPNVDESGGYHDISAKEGDTFPPPVAKYDPDTGEFNLKDGDHRLAYFKDQGYTHVPMLVQDRTNALGDVTAPPAPEVAPETVPPAVEPSPGPVEASADAGPRLETRVPDALPVPTTPQEAQQIVSSIEPAKPKGRVDQVFRTDKFNVDEGGQQRLKEVQSALGLETRDVQHWTDVEKMAKELGRDPIKMVKAINGNRSLSAVEVQGLRDTVKVASDYLGRKYDLIDGANGDPVKIQEINQRADQYKQILDQAVTKLIGGGTEAGRAVAMYKNIAQAKMDDPTYWYKEAASLLEGRKSARFTGPGGEKMKVSTADGALPEDLRTAIDSLMKSGDQVGLSYLMSQLTASSTMDKAIGLWKAGLLSAPTTHLAKMTSELTFRSLETVKDIPATIVDKLLSTVTGETTKSLAPAKFAALGKGFAEGVATMPKMMGNAVDPYRIVTGDLTMPFETHYDNPIAEKYTQTIFRALGSETLPYKFAAFRQSLAEQAITTVGNMGKFELQPALDDLSATLGHPATSDDLIHFLQQKPSDAMVKRAIDETAYATFSGDNAIARGLSGFERAAPELKPVTQVILPFRKFPTNMALATIDYSPAGFIKTLVGQLGAADQKALSEGMGRAITGTSIMALGVKLAAAGMLTGEYPTSPGEQKLWDSAHKQPNSLLINGQWHAIDRLSVLGTLLTTGAALNDISPSAGPLEAAVTTAAGGAKEVLATTPLLGLSSALNALNDPERNAATWVDNAARGLIPNIIGRLAQGMDPLQRRPVKFDIPQILEARIPILSQLTPARQDVFGRDMPNHQGVISQLFDFTRPVTPVTDPVIKNLLDLNQTISTPSPGFLTPEEQRDELTRKGNVLYPVLHTFLDPSGPHYASFQQLNDEQKRAVIKSVDSSAGSFVSVQEKKIAADRISASLEGMSEQRRLSTMTDIMRKDRTLYEIILLDRQKK